MSGKWKKRLKSNWLGNILGIRRGIPVLISILMLCGLPGMSVSAQQMEAAAEGEGSRAEQILAAMSLEEKLAQMIIPAIRTWNEENVTDLSEVPELAEALRKHPYGGIILYASNVTGSEQVTELVADLQANNAAVEGVATHIPYLMPIDQEGGTVIRLTSGTRMNGNMAIGAAGEHAQEYAQMTGYIIGTELAAAGFNADFAPVIDVNNNAANPVIGTRSFSDDAQTVSELGLAYGRGLEQHQIIPTYKHYPGHGDTGTDSHIGTPSIEKTYEQIKEVELVPFEYAISAGADMIMTAHITYPLIDEEVVFGDGETKGYYPATMSRKMITEILRGDLGFDGVVVTDALEMGAIQTSGLVPGEAGSTEYQVNIAEQVINAGVDLLLLPVDMVNEEAVSFYDEYIAGLSEKVADGEILEDQIDAAVLRILKLKETHGILDTDVSGDHTGEAVREAAQVLGCEEHHKAEAEIAQQSVTLLKNEGPVLPAEGFGQKIVIAGRNAEDVTAIVTALRQLQEQEILDPAAQIVDLVNGETTGDDDAGTTVTIDFYYDPSGEETSLHYTEELKAAVSQADTVIVLSKTYSLEAMADTSDQYRGVSSLISDAHANKARAVLLSDNLPYDASRYQDADAILLAYMGSGLDVDPTARADGSGYVPAYNANVVTAIRMIFGDGAPQGTLPVHIPAVAVQEDGTLAYTEEILYERGFGLKY